MKIPKTDHLIAILTLAMAIPLCSCAGPSATINIEALHQHQNCAQTKAGLYLLDDQSAVDNAINKQLPTRFNSPKPESTDIDFQHWSQQYWLVLASLGQKPSGGFSIDLAKNTSTIKNKEISLSVSILEPAKDSFQTMALTSPCLLMAVEKGEYSKIKIEEAKDWAIDLESR